MGVLQARILEWVAIPFSRRSSQPRHRTQVPCIAGRFSIIWATREAPNIVGSVCLMLEIHPRGQKDVKVKGTIIKPFLEMMRVVFFFFLFFPKYLHINVTSSPNILGDKQSGSYEGWEAGCAPGGGEHWRLATPLTLQQSLRHKSPEQLEDEGLLRFPHEGTVGPRVISLAWVDLLERQVMVWLVFSGEFTGEFSEFLESLYAPIPNRQKIAWLPTQWVLYSPAIKWWGWQE